MKLLQRFADAVRRKLLRLTQYVVKARPNKKESIVEETSRHLLGWFIEAFLAGMGRYPYLHPNVAAVVEQNLRGITENLLDGKAYWNGPPIYQGSDGAGQDSMRFL